jgi:hypothetical protein
MPLVIRNKVSKKYVSEKGVTAKIKLAQKFTSFRDARDRLGTQALNDEWEVLRLMPMMNGKDANAI